MIRRKGASSSLKNHHRTFRSGGTAAIAQSRLLLVGGVFALVFLIVIFRLFEVTILGYKGDNEANARHHGDRVNFARRANVVDRNGELIAVNLQTASLYVNPHLIFEPEKVARELHLVLPEFSEKALLTKFHGTGSFYWIKRNLTPKEQYAVNALGVPGLQFRDEEGRIYPQGRLFSHVLGYVGIDGQGLSGIEKHFNKRLIKNSDEPLQLSLDVRVQSALYQEIQEYMELFRARAAIGVVMDVNTAEVLGMVSFPDFDPHNPLMASQDALFNRATLGVYEQGSTFKTFTMAMGLDTRKIDMESSYDVATPIKIGRFSITDTHPKNGWMSVPEIYIHSSNIGTAKVALDIGVDTQRKYLGKLGLLSPLTLELPECGKPLLPSKWEKTTSITVSFGHGIAVTPLHVAQATSAVVNGGIFHEATLLKHDTMSRGTMVVSEKTSENIRRLMRMTVEKGTGKRGNVEGYLVGGKTGTAEKPGKGGYDRKAMLSSFVAVFPMNQPRYLVMVSLDEPKGTRETGGFATGGMTAAPVVRNVIARIAPLLGLMPVDEQDKDTSNELYVKNDSTGRFQLAAF
ncbi:MAG: peptidoglycan glycosyltransferase [Rickettsiales bacterium]|jgi:cell division protein FtsI (penicillin-binding protein 3)|nr:peptidoglycan glycosyltransferase [Rickettsiales bacterium]